jgi:hypothetical protein
MTVSESKSATVSQIGSTETLVPSVLHSQTVVSLVYFESGGETYTQTVVSLLYTTRGVETHTQTVVTLSYFATRREIHTFTVIQADSMTFVMSIAVVWSDVPTYVLVTAVTYVSIMLEGALTQGAEAMGDGMLIGIVSGSAAAVAVLVGAVVFIVRKGVAARAASVGGGGGEPTRTSVTKLGQMDQYSDGEELSGELSTTLAQTSMPETAISTLNDSLYRPSAAQGSQADSIDDLWM